MPYKSSQQANSSTNDDGEDQKAHKDDRSLCVPLEERVQYPWTHPHDSHNAVTGRSSQDDTSNTSRSDPTSQRLNGIWKERTRDQTRATGPDNTAKEPENEALDDIIGAKSDATCNGPGLGDKGAMLHDQ